METAHAWVDSCISATFYKNCIHVICLPSFQLGCNLLILSFIIILHHVFSKCPVESPICERKLVCRLRSLRLEGSTPCAPIRIGAATSAFPSIQPWLLCAQRRKPGNSSGIGAEGEENQWGSGCATSAQVCLLSCLQEQRAGHTKAWARLLRCLGYRK